MDYHGESGFSLELTGSFDLETPEERFLTPQMVRLRSWLARADFEEAEVNLRFEPGIFIFSEVNCDDRDSGLYESRYTTTLLPLSNSGSPNWASPSIAVERTELRPLSEIDNAALSVLFNATHPVFESLLRSYVNFISERSNLRMYHNDDYNVYSVFGESLKEFRQECIELALVEKSELALKLSTVIDRELQQQRASLEHELSGSNQEEDDEALEQINTYVSGCKRLLNRAVSLHVLDVNVSDEAETRWTYYSDTLREVADTIADGIQQYEKEFQRYADNLIERFSEIEKDTNSKALAIDTLKVPLSSCSMRILRVEKVWLPFWNIRYARNGKFKEHIFKAH